MTVKDEKSGDRELPPGQRPIKRILRWGKDHPTITSSGAVPKIDLQNWVLVIDGEVEKAVRVSWSDFQKYPKTEAVKDFHCVEGWSVLGCRWEGVNFKYIVELVKPREAARFVSFECADGYTTSLTLEELLREDALLAYRLDGEDLEEGLGGPLRLIVSNKYGYKSAMWLMRIRFTSKKDRGYWESRGYSDTADVWRNDWFSGWRF